jgi:hypothetical protein
MLLQVDFYKDTGKWYEGGTVDVGDARPYVTGEIEQALVDKQDILTEGWQGGFYVVVNNATELTSEESQAGLFCMRLYKPSDFYGFKKRNKEAREV